MKKVNIVVLSICAVLGAMVASNFACLPKVPGYPAGLPPALTITATPTSTPTTTPTGTLVPTSTPFCAGVPDVSSNIYLGDYFGDDTGKTIPGSFTLDQGGTTTGDILSFSLISTMTLNFSLCPTEQTGRKIVMYIRKDCRYTTGEIVNTGYCSGLPQLTNVTLTAGTYFILLAENTGSISPGGAPYRLRIKQGNLSLNICNPANGVVPEVIPAGTFASCSNYYQMNGNPMNGNFGDKFSGARVVTGVVDEAAAVANSDDFVAFIPAHSGPVTVTMECFDAGLDVNDFDIYCASDCPTNATIPTIIGSSNGLNPIEKFIFAGTGGTTYYLDIQAYQGYGPYRVTVDTP